MQDPADACQSKSKESSAILIPSEKDVEVIDASALKSADNKVLENSSDLEDISKKEEISDNNSPEMPENPVKKEAEIEDLNASKTEINNKEVKLDSENLHIESNKINLDEEKDECIKEEESKIKDMPQNVEIKIEESANLADHDDKKETLRVNEVSKEEKGASSILDNKENILPSVGILPELESSCGSSNIPVSESVHLPPLSEVNTTNTSTSTTQIDPSEVSHKVKRIKWKDTEVPIITQNNNGPCPLLAILNAMILKGKITLPRDRQELTGGELVSIVGNAVFDVPRSSVPSEMHSYLEQNTQDAVSILHKLLTGLDVNIKFSGVKDFEFTSELSIFDVLEVSLYHGWVVEPSSEASSIVSNLSYNQLTNNIIMWRDQATSKNDNDLLLKAMICEEFICETISQLTIHGLFELLAALAEGEIAVLFRNNHFSTIYKRNGQLYQLLSDQGFLLESAVWETLTDIDATFSEFVDGNFQPIHQHESNSEDIASMTKEQQINSDHQLAAMLQQEAEKQQRREEDFNKMVEDLGLHNLSDEEIARRLQNRENQLAEEANRNRGGGGGGGGASSQTSEVGSQSSSRKPYNQTNYPTNHHKRKKDCTIL
ncbi:UNVERIFIED_CONTAM: hypothetical protein RMT77_013332 [Armadillidium vulgare]